MQPDEKRIIERCQRGDRAAFNDLVLKYEKQVYNLAYRLTGNYDDANDVASDAFLRVFNSIGKFRGDSAFSTWLYRIVTNVFLDRRKRRLTHPHVSLEAEMTLEEGDLPRQIEDPAPGPEVEAEKRELRRVLQAAINELPEFQRVIITLYHLQELPYDEISEILQMPLGTVKSRLNRARKALRERLASQKELYGE